MYLSDNQGTWEMDGNGHYTRKRKRPKNSRSAQEELIELLKPGSA